MVQYYYSKYQTTASYGTEPAQMWQDTNNYFKMAFAGAYKTIIWNGTTWTGGTTWKAGEMVNGGNVAYTIEGTSDLYKWVATHGNEAQYQVDVNKFYTNPQGKAPATNYARGALVQSNLVADLGTYPDNGRHSDGFWYVRGSALPTDTAPTTPGSITVSGTMQTGQTLTVTWGASTDAEGHSIGYYLEVQRNGGSWETLVSNGGSRSRNYDIPNGTTSLVFRVRALANGLYSGYRMSTNYTVANNSVPTLTLATTDNRTLYENDQFNVTGQVTDTDVGNVVIVKFSINGGTERAIASPISQGSAVTYNKVLTFKQGKLFDGANAITDTLADGSQHVLRVWAEDDKGGKSAEQIRVFYVVANRSAILTIDPVASQSELIDADSITFNGNVSDPDGNNVSVKYKIGNGSLTEVYNGTGGAYSFTLKLANLQTGVNTVTVQATDSYNLTTTKTLRVTKSENAKPLLKSVATYKLIPPNGAADGVVLWIQRETGDLTVDAEISMGATGAAEDFKPMIKASTAYVSDTIEEDEFTFDNGTNAENIVVRLTMTRTNATSDIAIKLISGVLS